MKRIIIAFFIIFSVAASAESFILGDVASFDKAFEQRFKSDGASSEELDIEIGKMIKTHPTNFLKSLLKNKSRITRLDSIVGNLGYEYVDQFEKMKIEIEARIASLEKAKQRSSDQKIKDLARQCIEKLKELHLQVERTL